MNLLLALVLVLAGAMPVAAGGRAVSACPAGSAIRFDVRGQGRCEAISGLALRSSVVAERGQARRLLCPYPYRPSDAVFSGGSGYLIKDDVRRAQGCL